MSDPHSPQIPTSETSPLKSLLWTAWMLLTHLVACVVVIAVLIRIVPRFVTMFAEFEAEVAPMTEVLIVLSNLVAHWWHLLLPFGLVVDAVLLFALSRLPAGMRWLGTLWATLVLVAALVFLGLVIFAIMLPLEELLAGFELTA